MKYLLWITAAVCVFGVACAGDQTVATPSERTAVAAGALEEEAPLLEREIAIVIDGSGNMDAHCDWDPDSWTYGTDSTGSYPIKPTRMLCDNFDGFEMQRRGLIHAIREMVPLGSKVALSVVLSVSRQQADTYLGPQVVVPYTVIRTEEDKNHVIGLLQQMQVATAQGMPNPNAWMGSFVCEHNYDSAFMSCPSVASHAWAVNTALAVLEAGPPIVPTPDGGVGQPADADHRARSREICLAGDLAHTRPPRAYWLGYTVFADQGVPPVQWPAGIPEEAKQYAPFESAPAVDRFTAIELTQGITGPVYGPALAAGERLPFWYDQDWGAILSFSGEVSATNNKQLVLSLSEISGQANAAPVPTVPPIPEVTLPVSHGMTGEQIATLLNELLWQLQNTTQGQLPVVSSAHDNEVLLGYNSSHPYHGSFGTAGFYPHVRVQQVPDGLDVTLSGGSNTQPGRTVENEHVFIQDLYAPLIKGCSDLVFPSGRMATHPLTPEAERTYDYANALSNCFGTDAPPLPAVNEAPSEQDPGSSGGSGGGTGTGGGTTDDANQCLDKVRLVEIEVNQVIQDWNNSIPLIERKPTVARVFLETSHTGFPAASIKLHGLKYENAGQPCSPSPNDTQCVAIELPDSPAFSVATAHVPTRAREYRGDLSKSARVLLPESWLTEPRLYIKAEGVNCQLDCREIADLTPARDCTVRVHFDQHKYAQLGQGAAPGPITGLPLVVRQLMLDWDETDTEERDQLRADRGTYGWSNLEVLPEERLRSHLWAQLQLPVAPSEFQVQGLPRIVQSDVAAWRRSGSFTPDSNWWKDQLNAMCEDDDDCKQGPGRTVQQEGQWIVDHGGLARVNDFVGDVLLDSLIAARREACTRDSAECILWHGLYHTPPRHPGLGGVSRVGTGTAVEDVGYPFDTSYVGGAHEMMHALGREHTDYCMAGYPDQHPRCDEPYPYELLSGATLTAPSQGTNRPPAGSLPLIGPLRNDDTAAYAEVWGLDPGLRTTRVDANRRPVYSLFPRDRSSDPDAIRAMFETVHDPRTTYDPMSYCPEDDSNVGQRWVSRFQYERLFGPVTLAGGFRTGDHIPRFTSFGDRRPMPIIPGGTDWCAAGETPRSDRVESCRTADGDPCSSGDRTIGGSVDLDAQDVVWSPSFDVEPRAIADRETDGIMALLSFRDALGVERFHANVGLEGADKQAGSGSTRRSFFTIVPSDPDVTEVVLSVSGTQLSSVQASAHAPTVSITSPAAGSAVNGDRSTFTWNASDADNDPLSYEVSYSPNGDDWFSIGNVAQPKLDYPTAELPGGDQAYLRVTVSDGFRSASDMAGPFSVLRKPPQPHIVSFAPNQEFSGREQVFFHAVTFDPEALLHAPPPTVVWGSDRDGILGSGRISRQALRLSEGDHVITATATDIDGLVGTTQTTIHVKRFATDPFTGPRLSLRKSHEADFEVGLIGSYTLTVQNVGTSPTTSAITVADTLPAELEYIGAQGTNWTCDADGQVVTCTYSGSPLAVGASAPPITLDVEPQLPATPGAASYNVTNRAVAALAGAPSEANSDTEDPTVVQVPDAPVLHTDTSGAGAVRLNQPIHFTLMVTNGGDTHAHELAVDMSVAIGAEITSVVGQQWSCTVAATTAHCVYIVDAVAPGEVLPTLDVTVVVHDPNLESINLQYSASARSGTQLVLDAGVNTDAGAPATSSGQTQSTLVQAVRENGPDLGVIVWDPCEPFTSGVVDLGFVTGLVRCNPGVYDPRKGRQFGPDTALVQGGIWQHRIEVWNVGNETASMPITLVDALPVGAEPLARTEDSDWLCSIEGRNQICDYIGPPIEPYRLTVLNVTFTIADDAPKSLTNTVTATTFDDVDTSNDSVSHTLLLRDKPCKVMSVDGTQCMDDPWNLPATGLNVAINVPSPLVVGQPGQATFTVTNTGATSILKNNVVLDALGDPSLLLVSGYSGAGWSCGLNWGKAACTYFDPSNGSLASGASLPALVVDFTTGPFPYEQMLIPAQVGTPTTNANRVFATAAVQATGRLVGPAQGTLAISTCPPGTDCVIYKQQYPSKFPRGRREVRLLDLATLNSEWLASRSEEPAWNNDGSLLAMTSVSGNCSPSLIDDDCNTSVYVYYVDGDWVLGWSSDGAKAHSLTIGDFNGRFGSWTLSNALVFSEVSTCGACNSDYPDVQYDTHVQYNLQLVANQTRSNHTGLFHLNSGTPISPGTQDVYPAVSPVIGLAYTSGSPQKIWISDFSAALVNQRRLTTAAASVKEETPAWSRDGNLIAFSSNGSIHVISKNGTGEVAITGGLDDRHPTWSPDGSKIAFERGGSDPGIFIVDSTGGTPVLVGRGRHPAWRPTQAAAAAPPAGPPPVAALDHFMTPLSLPIAGNVLANDSDPGNTALTLVSSTSGMRGDVTCTPAGQCTYTPRSGFEGQDEFTYVVRNAGGAQATGTVAVEVTGVSPHITIDAPADKTGFTGNSTVVSGYASLDYLDPHINVIYAVDTNSAGATSGGVININSSYYPTGGNPNSWKEHAPGVPSLCDALGPGDLVQCWLVGLNRSLARVPSVSANVLTFADDYLGVKTASTYWTLPSPLHRPPDYRSNVYHVDVDPTFRFQYWAPLSADMDADGIPDVEKALRSLHRFQPGQRSCYWGNSGGGGVESVITSNGEAFGPTRDGFEVGDNPNIPNPGHADAGPPKCRYSAGGGLGGSEAGQTYDFILKYINEQAATRPITEHNVAYLISAGRARVDEMAGGPLQEAVHAGTVIHTFAPKAPPVVDPVDIVWLVDARTSSASERNNIAARMSEFATDLDASGLDYNVLVISDTNWFAGTPIAARTTFSQTGGDPVPRLSSGDFLGWARPAATEHVIGVNITSAPVNEANRKFFGHAITPLGPEWCPGATANTVAFNWADPRRGVKILTCDPDWDDLMRSIEQPSYPNYFGWSYFAVPGERPVGSCEPSNPLARIAQVTGGTCTEISWDVDEINAKLPPLPKVGASEISAPGVEDIDHITVARTGGGAPIVLTPDSLGRYTTPLSGLVSGPNTLNATLYLKDGHTTSASVTIYGQSGYNTPPFVETFPIDVAAGYPRDINMFAHAFDSQNDAFTLTSWTQGEQGSVTCTPTGMCTYLAPAGTVGQDSFSFTLTDARGGISTGTQFLILNNPPTAQDQTLRVRQGESIAFYLYADDPDFDGLTFDVGFPKHGQVGCDFVNGTGCTYQADATFTGIDSFSYTVSDGRGGTATGSVTVLVSGGAFDAAVAISHDDDFVVGADETYRVIVANNGAQAIGGVRLGVHLPGLTYRGFSGDGWTCTLDLEVSCSNDRVVVPGELFPLLTLQVVPRAEALPETVASVEISVGGDVDRNNDTSQDTTVVREPGIDVSMELTAPTVCLSGHFTAQVKNEGGDAIAGGLHVDIYPPTLVNVTSVSGQGWTCAPTPDGFGCDYGVAIAPFQNPPSIEIEADRLDPYQSADSIVAVAVVANDTNPDNDGAYQVFQIGDASSDYDSDGLISCQDNCPDYANPDQLDTDGDGFGDICDSCPRHASTDQYEFCGPSIHVNSVVSDGQNLSADIETFDPDNDPLFGEVRIESVAHMPKVTRVRVTAQARCYYGEVAIKAGDSGQILARPHWTQFSCTCQAADAIRTIDVTDPSLLSLFESPSYYPEETPIFFSRPLPATLGFVPHINYVKVEVFYDDGQSQPVCLFDGWSANPTPCSYADICSVGGSAEAIEAYAVVQPPPVVPGGTVLRTATYANSDPSLAFDISDLPSGNYLLYATADDGHSGEPAWDYKGFVHEQEDGFSTNPSIALQTYVNLVGSGAVCSTSEFTFEVADVGSAPTAGPVHLQATLPAGVSFDSASGDGWDCVLQPDTLTCDSNTLLQPGESLPLVHLQAQIRTPAGSPFTITSRADTVGANASLEDVSTWIVDPGDDSCLNTCAVTCSALDQCHLVGTCNPATGTCSNPGKADGTACDDGNASTVGDACIAGTCSGVNLCANVTCTALDQCHVTGTCNPSTGTCSNPSKANGSTCNDGNTNTVNDVCTNGSCAGVDLCLNVTCTALDQCHVAGTCDHATGVCSNPNRANGTTCNDGNANTVNDVCLNGTCTGGDLCLNVTCTALDQCHVAGTCNPANGTCSNPSKANGTTCNDANANTVNDVCTNGTCAGVDLCANVTCTALDQCHVAGTCDHANGTCSNPSKANGTTCNDANANTVNDVCTNGSCAGVDLCANVTCTALDQCHLAGVCDHATGTCSNPSKANGTTCNDANANTVNDVCTNGSCAGVDLCANVTCTALDQCHVAGTCDHSNGTCSNPNKANGTTCNDANANTVNDVCTNGTCAGVDLCANVTCTALDQCHVAGVCDHANGTCSNPNKTNGTTCNDANANTVNDVCTNGTCAGVDLCANVTCTALDQCHVAGACDHSNGTCSNPSKTNGATCNDANANTVNDVCTNGTCAGVDLCANVTCTALDQCHVAGTCDHANGQCSNPAKANGSSCSDSNACTTSDTCQGGICTGGAAPNCNDASACTLDSCNTATGCVHAPQHLAPVFTTPPPSPVPANNCGAVNIGTAAASDPCSAQSVTVTNDACGSTPAPCGDFGRGNKTVIWTALDQSGFMTQTSSTVTVTDTTPPINVVAPPPITLASGTSVTQAMLDPSNARSALDTCGVKTGQAISWRTVPALPATLPNGTSSVLWYARDDLGNENPTPVSQQVTVPAASTGATEAWTGHNFSCVLGSSGKPQCWGTNSDGELGDGTNSERWAPASVSLTNVTQLGVGYFHACAVTSSGGVQCWGEGANGRLGNNSILDRSTPVAVSNLSNAKQVSGGGDVLAGHSCALLNNGEVWCWGAGGSGRLGNNSILDRLTPVKAQFPAGTIATQVSVGGRHSCAIDTTGKAWCWGEGISGEIGNGSFLDRQVPTLVSLNAGVSITEISTGGEHVCALDTQGRVWCWGENVDGQLGNNSILNRNTPAQVTLPGSALQVSAGNDHTCAVLTNGQIWCWGEGSMGRLGNGQLFDKLTPSQVTGVTGAIQVSAGDNHTCARVLEGGVAKDVCWGGNANGQLGNGMNNDSTTAVAVARMCAPTVIDAGEAFSCAAGTSTTSTAVLAWGANLSSQLGDGTNNGRRASQPASNSSNASTVSCGSVHGCTVVGGQARCWGSNGSGRLGDGTTTSRNTPVAVSGGDTYIMVAAGDAHSCGIISGGVVKCWGSGLNGRLGNGGTANKLVPTSVTGLPGTATWITAGDAHSCAVVTNGGNKEVWCWGAGASGRLGNGGTIDATTPVKATGITTARAVSAGAQHTCATTTAGTAYCWGYGGNGRLGNGLTSNSNVPVLVQNTGGTTLAVSTAAVIASGDDFSCVTGVGASNQLACWGNNASSQLGDGTTSTSTRAKVVATSSSVSWVGAGDAHACAIMSGLAYCWGSNNDGRLGDGTTTNRSTPRLVAVEECN